MACHMDPDCDCNPQCESGDQNFCSRILCNMILCDVIQVELRLVTYYNGLMH